MTSRRRVPTLVVALLVLLAGLPTARAAGAQSVSTRSLRLAAQTPWLEPGGTFDLHLDVRGSGPDDALDLVVTVHAALRSRSAFAQSVDGRAGTVRKTVTLPLAEVPFDASGARVVSLPLPRADSPAGPTTLPALAEGTFPVTVSLRDGRDTLDRFVTHIVRLPEDPALTPLSVAWVQPLGADPLLEADGTRELRRAERDALDTVLAAVADNPSLPMTLDVTPETVAALPESEVAPVRRAVAGGSQLLATPYVDVDPSALEEAGLGGDLALQRQTGEEALAAVLGSRGDPRTWSSDQPITAAAARRLRTLGITRLVLPEDALVPLGPEATGGRTLTRPFALDIGAQEAVQAAAVDTTLTSYFQEDDDTVLAAHHLLADLAVLFRDLPGTARGVVVRPPDAWVPDPAFLDVVLPGLDVPILRPVTVEQLFDEVDPLESDDASVVRALAPSGAGGGLPGDRFREAHAALDELVGLVGPTSPRVGPSRTRLLVAQSRHLSSAPRNALLDDVLAERDEVRGGIRVPQRRFRLTAREGTIAVSVINDNDVPVRVELVLSSDKLEFTDVEGPDRSRQVLPLVLEHRNQTLTVPVRARVSATFSVQARVLAPGGAEILRSRFTIVSTAFSGVGIFLSIGAGLFLLLWWGSHWRTVRRDRRLVEAPK